MILHITTRAAWEQARAIGEYRAPSLETEGFIHCSTETQALAVANAFYRGQQDLVLLLIDEAGLKDPVKWEAPTGPPSEGISAADSFPHVYGPINLAAVSSVLDFVPDTDGMWTSLPL
ncbi:MAG: DUF952 domain-containing protein [Chloroflexi bacterium]|nr:DUF952 domain-containing protein [Chloroflexota bacterium]